MSRICIHKYEKMFLNNKVLLLKQLNRRTDTFPVPNFMGTGLALSRVFDTDDNIENLVQKQILIKELRKLKKDII